MSIICPTVLAKDKSDFLNQLKKVSFADRIQIDVMDGIFTNSKSIHLSQVANTNDLLVDLHVMYQQPQMFMDEFFRISPNMIIVHAESNCDIPKLASDLRERNIKTGLAVLQNTAIKDVSYIFPHIQHLLIFAGNLGHYGGTADISMLRKIEEAKKYTKYLEYGWDGGANLSNIVDLHKGGVDIINVGSAIQGAEEPKKVFEQMNTLLNN